jgi:hypothetical protein
VKNIIALVIISVFLSQAYAKDETVKLHKCSKQELKVYRDMGIGTIIGGGGGGAVLSIFTRASTIGSAIAGAIGAAVVYEYNMRQVCTNTISGDAQKNIEEMYDKYKKDHKS